MGVSFHKQSAKQMKSVLGLGVHPENSLIDVPQVSQITEDQFLKDFLLKCQPVVIKNGARNWPAMQSWSFDYFRSLPCDFEVTLEEGNVMQDSTSFRSLSFGDYLNEIENPSEKNGRTAYLSVFNIFQHFPDLERDVDFSLLAQHKLINHAAGWIGPGGTVTGYHIDWADNLLVQIVGRKLIKLVSPEQRRRMYPSSKYDSNTLMSCVDPDNYSHQKHPEFGKVEALWTVLEPGDILFNPRGWWHHVRAIDPSISVNNFGIDWKSFIRDKPREYAKKYLHRFGLYGKECTCHMIKDGKRVARHF